jgi:hypothetical protein
MLRCSLLIFALTASGGCGLVNAFASSSPQDASDDDDDEDDNDDDDNDDDDALGGEGEGESEVAPGSCHGGPLLTAEAIAVGFDRSCALTCSGIVCWGADTDVLPPPPGDFREIAVGQSFACALDDDGAIECWGYASHIEPDVALSTIRAGQDFLCGLSSSGALACFGAGGWPSFEAPSGVFDELAVGWGYVCGKRLDTGAVQCGGTTPRFNPPPTSTTLTNIGVGSYFACALDDARAIVCFDEEGIIPLALPSGAFSALGVGDGSACAIDADDAHLACFSDTDEGQGIVTDAPAGRYTHVAVADSHACAIREDAVVVCWGNDGQGRIDVPPP